jgi:hypothetical protein
MNFTRNTVDAIRLDFPEGKVQAHIRFPGETGGIIPGDFRKVPGGWYYPAGLPPSFFST